MNSQEEQQILNSLHNSNFHDALSECLAVLERSPDDVDGLWLFGIAAAQTSRVDLAITALMRALISNPALADSMPDALKPILVVLARAEFLLRSPAQMKHFWRWLASLEKDYLLDRPSPWITFDAIDFITPHLRRGMKIFEYGSGGSTLFWLKQEPELLVTIEHEPTWYEAVKQRIGSRRQIDFRLIQPEYDKENGDNASNPDKYASGSPDFSSASFYNYVNQIDEFEDEQFDIVMIDGRSRPSCIKHAHRKVKPGGFLIIDNSDRPYYFENTMRFLERYDLNHFVGAIPGLCHICSTTVAIRHTQSG